MTDQPTGADLGPALHEFTFDTGAVGAFLGRLFVTVLALLGLAAALVAVLTGGGAHPVRGAAGDVIDALLCLILTVAFGYFLWSMYQVSGHRTAVFTVHERGLVHSLAYDEVHELEAVPARTIIPWVSVAEVAERRRTSWLARWLLPPSRRYQAAVVVREGWALVFTDATRDAARLAALVRTATDDAATDEQQSGLEPS